MHIYRHSMYAHLLDHTNRDGNTGNRTANGSHFTTDVHTVHAVRSQVASSWAVFGTSRHDLVAGQVGAGLQGTSLVLRLFAFLPLTHSDSGASAPATCSESPSSNSSASSPSAPSITEEAAACSGVE